jgi:hypothetical protein
MSSQLRRTLILAVMVLLGTLAFVAPGPAGATTPGAGPGYWLFGGDGGVFPFGRGAYAGGLATRPTNAPVVGGAVSPGGLGYWLAAADGGVFAFGSAPYAGGMVGRAHAPITAIAPTPDGRGYWLVARDGGVFAFGNASWFGSLSGRPHAPIVSMAATPDGAGYWLAATDGAVYAFGDAAYLGGLAGRSLGGAIVALVPSGSTGYWLAGSDGGVYAFGDAAWLGSLSDRPHAPIVGMARLPNGPGYWLVGTDGGVFGFGEAGFFGSVGASRLNRGIVGIASGDGIAVPHAPAWPFSTAGFDISWPQCGRVRPAPPYGFGVVGITGGHLFSANPCLSEQWDWARTYGSFAAVYVNTNAPDAAGWLAYALGPARRCGGNAGCVLDLWGRRGADEAMRAAHGISAPLWWLDVETGNQWLPDTAANAVVLRAVIDELQRAGHRVGIYSTAYQWAAIAGSFAPGLPTWAAGAPPEAPDGFCAAHSFAGGPTWMSQSGDANFDTDHLCAAGLAAYREAFAPPLPLPVPRYVAVTPQPKRAPPTFPPPPAPARAAPAIVTRAPATIAAPPMRLAHHSSAPAPLWLVVLAALAALVAQLVRRRRPSP